MTKKLDSDLVETIGVGGRKRDGSLVVTFLSVRLGVNYKQLTDLPKDTGDSPFTFGQFRYPYQ